MQSIGRRLPKSRPIEHNPPEYLLGVEPQQWLHNDQKRNTFNSLRRESLSPAELSGCGLYRER